MLSAFKNFAVTFLIALLIFGIIAYFATTFVAGTVESIFTSEKEQLGQIIDKSSADGEKKPEAYIPGADEISCDSFNFLFVTTDYLPDTYSDYILSADDLGWYDSQSIESTVGLLDGDYREAHLSSIVFVRADKSAGEFVYVYLTPQMRVYTNSGYHTLSEIYYIYGMDKLCEHIFALTGMEVDYSFLVSGYNIDTFATYAGTVQVDNPKDIYSDGRYNTYSMSSTVRGLDEEGNYTEYSQANEFILWAGKIDMTPSRLYSVLSVMEHSKADFTSKSSVVLDLAEAYVKLFAGLGESNLRDTLHNLIEIKEAISTDFKPADVSSLYDLFKCADAFESVKIAYPCDYRAGARSSADTFSSDNVKGLSLLSEYRKLGTDRIR